MASRARSLALVLWTGLAVAMSSAAADERAAVMQVTQQACDAFRLGDVPAAEKLLAPSFTLVGSDASVQQRAAVLAEVKAREPRYEIFRNHSMTADIYGSSAVVQGITHLKGLSGGKPFEVEVRFTDTLIRNQGQWQLVVSHVTRIPPTAKQ